MERPVGTPGYADGSSSRAGRHAGSAQLRLGRHKCARPPLHRATAEATQSAPRQQRSAHARQPPALYGRRCSASVAMGRRLSGRRCMPSARPCEGCFDRAREWRRGKTSSERGGMRQVLVEGAACAWNGTKLERIWSCCCPRERVAGAGEDVCFAFDLRRGDTAARRPAGSSTACGSTADA